MMIQIQLTHDQATKLAAFVNTLRPDWDKPGIFDAIAKARTRGTACEVSVAAIRCATSAHARTPAVIAMDGAHWRDPEPDSRTMGGPRIGIKRRCNECHHLHAPEAPCLAPRDPDAAPTRAAIVRAALHAGKAENCSHGVLPADCADHRHHQAEEHADG